RARSCCKVSDASDEAIGEVRQVEGAFNFVAAALSGRVAEKARVLASQSAPKMKRAVFLDRDGTLIEEKEYLSRVEVVVIQPEAPRALRRLSTAGFRLFVVTNQSGVGRGFFTMAEVEKIHEFLAGEFGAAGVRFQKFYVAPERPEDPS